jgi:hypothetical protein
MALAKPDRFLQPVEKPSMVKRMFGIKSVPEVRAKGVADRVEVVENTWTELLKIDAEEKVINRRQKKNMTNQLHEYQCELFSEAEKVKLEAMAAIKRHKDKENLLEQINEDYPLENEYLTDEIEKIYKRKK